MRCIICERIFQGSLEGSRDPMICGPCCARFLKLKSRKETFQKLKGVSHLENSQWVEIYSEIYA